MDLLEVPNGSLGAYTCKQILGLCHLPPQLKNQSGLQKIENLSEDFFDELVWTSQNLACQNKGCCHVTYIIVCDRKKRKLSMERETWGFDSVIRPLSCVWTALPSHHRYDLLLRETLIVLTSKICDRPSIVFRQTDQYCGVCIPLFTISVLAPIMKHQCRHQSWNLKFARV